MLKRDRARTVLGFLVFAAVVPTAAHAAIGLAGARPYGEAVAFSRQAAQAVVDRAGTESCLRGKLTRALLGLSASCDAEGLRTPVCDLAERAVVVPVWSLPFLEATARELLAQI